MKKSNTIYINVNDAQLEVPIGPNFPAIEITDQAGNVFVTLHQGGFVMAKNLVGHTVGFEKGEPYYAGKPALYVNSNNELFLMHRETDEGSTIVRKVLLSEPI